MMQYGRDKALYMWRCRWLRSFVTLAVNVIHLYCGTALVGASLCALMTSLRIPNVTRVMRGLRVRAELRSRRELLPTAYWLSTMLILTT
jgi:hypothetical protein